MTASSYSFIDIAALDGVRERLAQGSGLMLLSADLDTVLWANGPGAGLFGFRDIDALIDAPPPFGPAARRQIAATSGFPRIGTDRKVAIRQVSGMASRVLPFLASTVGLPDGEPAILLAAPRVEGTQAERARHAIAGIAQPGQFAAILGEDGAPLAASDGFGGLRLPQEALQGLAAEAAQAPGGLLKRAIRAGRRDLPAGIARLTDEATLLIVVDETYAEHPDGEPDPLEEGENETEEALAFFADAAEAGAAAEELSRSAEAGGGSRPAALPAAVDEAERSRRLEALRGEPPLRFTWRTDADGRVMAVSPEFPASHGLPADALTGLDFSEIGRRFGFAPEGSEIAELLGGRDTWSGRTVLWPLAQRAIAVPVDLAALPTYSRSRAFEGFRGFGVVRRPDAVLTEEPAGTPEEEGEEGMPDAGPAAAEKEAAEGAKAVSPPVSAPTLKDDSDAIVQLLSEQSAPPAGGLSQREHSAFREIGERLKGEEAGREEARPEAAGGLAAGNQASAGEAVFAETDRAAEREPGIASPVEDAAPAEPDLWSGDGMNVAAGAASPDAAGLETAAAAEPTAADPEGDDAAGGQLPAQEPDLWSGDGMAVAGSAQHAAEEAAPSEATGPGAQTEVADAGFTASTAERTADDRAESLSMLEEPAAGSFPDAEEGAGRLAPPEGGDDALDRQDAEVPAGEAAEEGVMERAAPDTSILERIPIPVLIHAGDALHYANPEFLALAAYPTLEEFRAGGGLGSLFSDRWEGGSESGDRRLRVTTGRGEEFPVEALLRSAPWNGGKALLLVLRRVGEEAPEGGDRPQREDLEKRLSEMRAIVDTATDGVVLMGQDGTVRSISRPAEALFGLESDEAAGKPFGALFAAESQRAIADYLDGLSNNGVASVLNDGREVIGRESRGRFIPLFMTIGKLPGGFCAVVRDITQWKRAEEELTQSRALAERASSHKTEFLARVSHEIRTPLNAIIGFSELMLDEKFGPVGSDRYRDYLRDINRSGNHVLDLVNDLLDISKIEAGQQDMAYEAVSLNDALAETVATMQPQANRERVIIRSSFAARLPDVVADQRSVRQIALNILSNAIRFTQAGGQVIVSTAYEPSGDVALRVRDTGIGMSQGEIEQALKPFKQINALKRARGDGTGLGLPLTKAMVEANRARFAISSAPGEGTLVEITFPSTRVLAG